MDILTEVAFIQQQTVLLYMKTKFKNKKDEDERKTWTACILVWRWNKD